MIKTTFKYRLWLRYIRKTNNELYLYYDKMSENNIMTKIFIIKDNLIMLIKKLLTMFPTRRSFKKSLKKHNLKSNDDRSIYHHLIKSINKNSYYKTSILYIELHFKVCRAYNLC